MLSQVTTPSGKEREVAVIVVHGVGASDPGAAGGVLSSALVNALRVPNGPLPVVEKTTFSLPLEGVSSPTSSSGVLPAEDVLLRRQLDEYGGREAHETLTVPAYAIRAGNSELPSMDVYALWWGDIGSFGEGPWRAILYLLRLISRLFALGLTSIEAAADATGVRFWSQAEWWQRTFSQLVFGVIPTLTLLLAIAITAAEVPNLSLVNAELAAVLIAIALAVGPRLPTMLRDGKAGAADWAGRPAAWAAAVVLAIGALSYNSPTATPAQAEWYNWLTPWHILVFELMVIGLVAVALARQFVSVGRPAPRRPASLEARAHAPSGEPRRPSHQQRYAAHAGGLLFLFIPAAFGSDLWVLAILGYTIAQLLRFAAFFLMVAARSGRAARIRSAMRAPGTWRVVASLAAAWIMAVTWLDAGQRNRFGMLAIAGALAAWAAIALVRDTIADYRSAPVPGRAVPGIFGGALIIGWPAFLGLSTPATLGLMAASVWAVAQFTRLESYWDSAHAPAAPGATLREAGMAARVQALGRRNWPYMLAAAAAAYVFYSYFSTSVPELSAVPGQTIIAPNAQQQAVLTAVKDLQNNIAIMLPVAWSIVVGIVIFGPIVAIIMTVRATKVWSERRNFIRTLWTSIATSSATLVLILIVYAFLSHAAGVDEVLSSVDSARKADSLATLAKQTAAPTLAGDTTAGTLASQASRAQRTVAGAMAGIEEQSFTAIKILSKWAEYQLMVALTFIALLGTIAAWTLFPSIRADADPGAAKWGSSVQLGRWLTTGLTVLQVVAALGVPLMVMAAVFIAAGAEEGDLIETIGKKFATLTLGGALGTGFVVVMTQLGRALDAMRPVLALAADVEVYLRVAPADRTPRAQLLDRVCTLITHVERAGYRRIVVVAHSQGTVITADALRLRARLARERDAFPSTHPKARVSLITVGSPLQHLYATAFPYLYSWVQDTPEDADDGTANAAGIGVSQWINLYRSGDYIGRHLWSSGSDDERYRDDAATVRERSASGASFDTCIGYGGHTGYWSDSSVIAAIVEQAKIRVTGRATAANRAFREI